MIMKMTIAQVASMVYMGHTAIMNGKYVNYRRLVRISNYETIVVDCFVTTDGLNKTFMFSI